MRAKSNDLHSSGPDGSVVSDSLWPHGLRHTRLPCPSPTPGACSRSLCPSCWWCHPSISPYVIPISSHLQYFPASGSLQMSQFFSSGGVSIGVSVWILPVSIQDWVPLGLTDLIFLQSKGLSTGFPNTTAQKHQFFKTFNSLMLSLLYGPALTSIHDYWKNHI